MRLLVTIYATKSYCYALKDQATSVLAALRYAEIPFEKISILLVSDNSQEACEAFDFYCAVTNGTRIDMRHIIALVVELKPAGEPHEKQSNILIAKMQAIAFTEAQRLDVDYMWSVESDVLPNENALRCSLDALTFDKGYYDVAMATYPNDGFLGGRANPRRWILPSIYPDERKLSKAVQARADKMKKDQDALNKAKKVASKTQVEAWQAIEKEIEAAPPKGNAWQLNAERWRPRGWLEHAYPGIGLGAVLPTDWVGMGCTLLSRRAINCASFTGYDGGGTQDLWLCWKCWHPRALKMAVLTHALASHVKTRIVDGKKSLQLLYAHHELGGEYHGHLRVDAKPFTSIHEAAGTQAPIDAQA